MIEDFISGFNKNADAYKAWGKFVASEIYRSVKLEAELKEKLLKVPVQYRLKKESSIRGKIALHNITDPRSQVRDLYGLRFVVLLSSEVRLVEEAVKASELWASEKVRDFGVDAVGNAEIFDYQSVHYIVTCQREVLLEGVRVSAGICCEVQIRTMLQHAYAELTHDNIYKPSHIVPYVAKRLVARSMALMETTDMIFCQTLEELKRENEPRNNLYQHLRTLYLSLIGDAEDKFDEKLNLEIIDFLRGNLDFENSKIKTSEFWVDRGGFVEKIRVARESSILFSQPVVLLLYWFASVKDRFLRKKWPFESMTEDLRKILSDLGIALGDN
jgi:ppGpp synthetase/RelA/SpoT-type nucleotidyltranferase